MRLLKLSGSNPPLHPLPHTHKRTTKFTDSLSYLHCATFMWISVVTPDCSRISDKKHQSWFMCFINFMHYSSVRSRLQLLLVQDIHLYQPHHNHKGCGVSRFFCHLPFRILTRRVQGRRKKYSSFFHFFQFQFILFIFFRSHSFILSFLSSSFYFIYYYYYFFLQVVFVDCH